MAQKTQWRIKWTATFFDGLKTKTWRRTVRPKFNSQKAALRFMRNMYTPMLLRDFKYRIVQA